MQMSTMSLAAGVTRFRLLARKATPERLAEGSGEIFAELVASLPERTRGMPIGRILWSQSFASNEWWRKTWRGLGVEKVADLAGVGARLATTRGVGRTKLLVLAEDLLALATATTDTPDSRARTIAIARRHLEAISSGPVGPDPAVIGALFESLVTLLPPSIRSRPVETLPWSGLWCERPELWSDLGITLVDDLGIAAPRLLLVRGIGRAKVLRIVDDLIVLCPELHALLRSSGQREARRWRPPADSLAVAIDRVADRLTTLQRDVLRRRIGWRAAGEPELLRVLAEDHGLTRERIRQIEQRLRARLANLLRLRGVVELLIERVRDRGEPVELAELVAEGPDEFRGLLDSWKPVADLLDEDGRVRLVEAQVDGRDTVVVQLRIGRAVGRRRIRPSRS